MHKNIWAIYQFSEVGACHFQDPNQVASFIKGPWILHLDQVNLEYWGRSHNTYCHRFAHIFCKLDLFFNIVVIVIVKAIVVAVAVAIAIAIAAAVGVAVAVAIAD